MARTEPFDRHLFEYEQWFINNYFAFMSELQAVSKVMPLSGRGMEIGIGSGVFAYPLGIKEGVEPSEPMRKKAAEREIHAIDAVAEYLPYDKESFDFVLMITTLCFVDDVKKSFQEIYRVLNNKGVFIIGFVDKKSPVGKLYMKNKDKSIFYKDASFYSTDEVYNFLIKNKFSIIETYQTIFGNLNNINKIQQPKIGYDEGSFIVIKAQKI